MAELREEVVDESVQELADDIIQAFQRVRLSFFVVVIAANHALIQSSDRSLARFEASYQVCLTAAFFVRELNFGLSSNGTMLRVFQVFQLPRP